MSCAKEPVALMTPVTGTPQGGPAMQAIDVRAAPGRSMGGPIRDRCTVNAPDVGWPQPL